MNCPKCGSKTIYIKGQGWYCSHCGELVKEERSSK